jgi:hypothetical protein
MAKYSKDPRWITARFTCECVKCRTQIKAGEKVFWFPLSRTPYCSVCGEEHARRFAAEQFDDDNNLCL